MNINKIESSRIVATIWLSGVTASGKTTLGKMLYEDLKNAGILNLKFFDGEDLRKIQDRVYGHSVEERFRLLKKYIKLIKGHD
jgi:adenylylsulfate kinase-like enzyme